MTDNKNDSIEKKVIANGNIPNHIAIIMDGNGRWAKNKNLPRSAGHKKGVETVRDIVKTSTELGIKYLTLYTFSTENWKRPKDEVSILMKLMIRSLKKEINELHKNNVRLTTIGDNSLLPNDLQIELENSLNKTKNNTGLVLNLALSYSGRWEIINAIKKIADEYKNKNLDLDSITELSFSDYLCTKNIPDPDLLIRSGGDFRVSNFLLWQIAYSEIFVTPTLWPNFTREDLFLAIYDFQNRERRFGLTSEQIKK